MNIELILTLLIIVYYLVWEIDWQAVERRSCDKWRHTFLNEKDYQALQKKLDEPPDEYLK